MMDIGVLQVLPGLQADLVRKDNKVILEQKVK
jgi:hypothetical protein